jgi:pilus assembly protein CpaE
MIAEVSASHKTADMFRHMAQTLTGRIENKRPSGGLLSPLLNRLKKRKG